jgi:hypothetical protein
MKKTKNGNNVAKALLLGTALVTLGAQEADAITFTDVGVMSAVIVTPIIVTNPTPMHFGSLAVAATAGDAVLDGADGLTTTGTVVSITGGPEAPDSGVLRITGTPGRSVVVTVAGNHPTLTAAQDTVVHSTAVTQTMVVDDFSLNNAGAADRTETVVLPTGGATPGQLDVPVGATLAVGVGQQDGTYTGAYDVIANYL